LRLLHREGIRDVILCLGYLGEMVRDRIGDGAEFGLKVAYSFDGEELRGTGGALKRALPLLGDSFFVLYGDSYLDIDYVAPLTAFRKSGLLALMTVYHNQGRWDTSNVLFDGAKVARYDKRNPTPDMQYIDYGLGILSSGIIAGWPEETFDLAALYAKLAGEGQLAGFEATRRFYEIGTHQGLRETDAYLKGEA
jgi:NDP-sugar pyrophosphorylase family protein